MQLEDELRQLREQYAELVERVNRNELKCDSNKSEHDQRIDELRRLVEEYRKELDEYKKLITSTIASLQREFQRLNEKQELLDKKQEEHGTMVQDLLIKYQEIKILSGKVEELIAARHSDLEKLKHLTSRVEELAILLESIQKKLSTLDRIPFLEEAIEEIRKLLIPPETINGIYSLLSGIQGRLSLHDQQFEQNEDKFNRLDSLSEQLRQRIDSIQTKDLPEINTRVGSIDQELLRHTSEIGSVKRTAENNEKQIDQLRDIIDDIQRRLSSVIDDINAIKEKLDGSLNQPKTPASPRQENSFDQQVPEASLKELIQPVLDALSSLKQQFMQDIKAAKDLLELLKDKLDALRDRPKTPLPPVESKELTTLPQWMLYKEPLQPFDLYKKTWTV